jgi:hypothetical protein
MVRCLCDVLSRVLSIREGQCYLGKSQHAERE